MPALAFHLRRNTDGSQDAICLACFQVVANYPAAGSTEEMEKTELQHVCERSLLL